MNNKRNKTIMVITLSLILALVIGLTIFDANIIHAADSGIAGIEDSSDPGASGFEIISGFIPMLGFLIIIIIILSTAIHRNGVQTRMINKPEQHTTHNDENLLKEETPKETIKTCSSCGADVIYTNGKGYCPYCNKKY